MGERLTSPTDARIMREGITAAVEVLEAAGFTRGQIGSVMIGIGAAYVAGESGQRRCAAVLKATLKALG